MKTAKTPALLAALALLLVIAAGCGSDDGSSSSANTTDAAFIADMTAHHEGAIDMAELAQQRAGRAEIRALADEIITAQRGEIAAMSDMHRDMRSTGMHDGDGHMGMSEHAMGMGFDMSALERARPFDKAFIDAMIPHHRGAIAMAKAELAKGSHPGLRRMAEGIIDAQTQEIAQMRRWHRAWYGYAP